MSVRKLQVTRFQHDGVDYLKDDRGFLFESRDTTGIYQGRVVGTVLNVNDTTVVLKKRVYLVYLNTKIGRIEICSDLTNVYDLLMTYEKANKETLWKVYNDGLKIIKEIKVIQEPTVNEAYRLVMATRSVIVITSILTNTPILMCFVACGGCKKEDVDSSFKKCGGCKKVYYCSSECNKLAWTEHKKVCKELLCCEKWL